MHAYVCDAKGVFSLSSTPTLLLLMIAVLGHASPYCVAPSDLLKFAQNPILNGTLDLAR